MRTSQFGLCVGLILAVSAFEPWQPSDAWAQAKNKNSAQEKKDDAKVKAEQEDLKRSREQLEKDEKQLRDAQKDLAEAQAIVKAAGRSEQGVRESIAAKQERALGIDQALSKQDDAKKSYEEVAAPILATLRSSPAFKAAKARAEAAHEEMKKIRSNSELSFDEKRRLEAAASQRALGVGELERDTVSADAKAKSLKEKFDTAQERVAELRAKIKVAVDADSSVKAAHQTTEKAREVVEAAQARANKVSQQVAASRAKLSKEANDVSRAVAADKANDNKNKGKKK